jgi:hypothetical protein
VNQLARYAALLDTADPKYAEEVLLRLPLWTDTTKEQMSADGVTDRASAISYWKKRFPLRASP